MMRIDPYKKLHNTSTHEVELRVHLHATAKMSLLSESCPADTENTCQVTLDLIKLVEEAVGLNQLPVMNQCLLKSR